MKKILKTLKKKSEKRLRETSTYVSDDIRDAYVPDVIDAGDVVSVYSGRNGNCCCGCSGQHTYSSKFRARAEKQLAWNDNRISDLTVKRIVGKINTSCRSEPRTTSLCAEYMTAVIGKRLYIAYFK